MVGVRRAVPQPVDRIAAAKCTRPHRFVVATGRVLHHIAEVEVADTVGHKTRGEKLRARGPVARLWTFSKDSAVASRAKVAVALSIKSHVRSVAI